MTSKLSAADNIKIIKKLIKYIRRYIPLLIFSMLFALVSAVFTLYIPVLIGESVDLIAAEGGVDIKGITGRLIKMGIIIGITGFVRWLMNACNNKLAVSIVRDIRHDAFYHLQEMPLSYIDSHPHGDIVSRLISDVDTFADGLLMGFNQLFTGLVTILGTLVFMVSINVTITLIVVIMTPISMFAAAFIAARTHKYFVKQAQMKGLITGCIDESISGIRVIKAFDYEEKTIENFEKINEELSSCALEAVFYSSTVNPTTRFVNNIIYAAVALTGALKVIAGAVTIGDLTCLLSYANQYTKPFNEISGVITELQNALCCAGRIFELMEADIEAEPLEPLEGISEGQVEFKEVAFSYVKDTPLIENLSLKVKRGMRVAIVGPTGCGKTTLINLLMRFYDVDGGIITIDDMDINKMRRSGLRSNFGMVLQDTFLFHGTIRDNIAMAKKDATLQEVIAAAKASHAHSFIKRLPKGYDTYIGEDLGGLSEGQKQLLCIARVMLLLPPMLILDEATSSIDTRTEMKIQSAFARLMEGRTSFIVAHRLSTIREADIILVMEKGHICEQGSHEELMQQKGFYYKLYTSQNGAEVCE